MADRVITIYDIAREAGVSPATVSRVLTGSARVSQARREAVLALVEKYNFQPNAMAKSLSDTCSRIIGLLVADVRNPFYAELAVACEVAAGRQGYTVLLCNAFGDPAAEERHLEKFMAQRVDAIIQIGCRVDDLVADPAYVDIINRIAQTTPFVSTGVLDGAAMHTVGIDNAEGLRLIFEHLQSLGHERIAMIGGRLSVRSTYDKWMRYIYLLGEKGIPPHPQYVQEGDYSFEGGIASMKRLLALKERPTAVIAINDYTATGALTALSEAGLRVPRDISLISFDNTNLAKITNPGLTSIDYGYDKLGEGLVDTALCLIRGEQVEREVRVTPTLIVRQSCGAPHARKSVSNTGKTSD